jgi:anaerobic magnesium-protoporphyrin IX monomethyl ester cyclase
MIIGELKDEIDRNLAMRWIGMYDDVMMGNTAWFAEFCERYDKEVKKSNFLTGRWELFTEETVPLLKKISCRFLLVGVETGDEDLRRNVLGRKQTDQLMLEKSALLNKYKILFGLYTMVGIPHETPEIAFKTVKLAARLASKPIPGHHAIFYPFEGTPLYDLCKKEDILSDRRVGSYFSDTKLDMPDFTRDQILTAHKAFKRYFIVFWFVLRLPAFLQKPFVSVLENRWNKILRVKTILRLP